MKNIMIVMIVMLMSLSLIACGNKESKDEIVLTVEKIESEAEENEDIIGTKENIQEEITIEEIEEVEESTENLEKEVISEADETIVPEVDSSYENQVQLIFDNIALWEQEMEMVLYCYAVTDLDRNGRLEIIRSSCEGTGMYTYSLLWEVNESFDALESCEFNISEYDSQPDIIVENVVVYEDELNEIYYYIFTDYIRAGMAENHTVDQALSLTDGEIDIFSFGSQSEYYSQETEEFTIAFADAEGNEITEEQYYELELDKFGIMKQTYITIDWIGDNEEAWQNDKLIALKESCEIFIGEALQ